MDNITISRAEYEEFKRRMEDENHRQNHRIDALEKHTEQLHALSVNVERLAVGVEKLAAGQEQQGKRLEVIENRDGEMWRKAVGYVLTTIGGLLLGLLFNRLGF